MCLVGATESHYGATTFMFVVENDRMCRESAVSIGEGGRVSAKAMQRPVPAAVIQRRTRQSLVSTMPAQCFIRPSIQRSPRYAVHSAQVHSALTWFSPPVATVARGVAAEQSPTTWSHRADQIDVVKKPNNWICFCADISSGRSATPSPNYCSLPVAADLFIVLIGGTCVANLDLADAYLQIEVANDRHPPRPVPVHQAVVGCQGHPGSVPTNN
nr:unnamed protein product [Spirometra erinaceieuropaei]